MKIFVIDDFPSKSQLDPSNEVECALELSTLPWSSTTANCSIVNRKTSTFHASSPDVEVFIADFTAARLAVMERVTKNPTLETALRDDPLGFICDEYLADSAAKCVGEDRVLFLIHANAAITERGMRQACEGIEFLKHLRLTERTIDGCDLPAEMRRAHAVVHSFESLENILRRKPEDLILCTNGVTFCRLPELIGHMVKQSLASESLQQLSGKLADLKSTEFRGAIRASYQPPDLPHGFANWWGVKRLIEGANEFHTKPNQLKSSVDLPLAVLAQMVLLPNKHAIFLSDANEGQSEVSSVINRERIAEFRLTIGMQQTDLNPIAVYVDDQMHDGWYEAVHFALSGRMPHANHAPSWLRPISGKDPHFPFSNAQGDREKAMSDLATSIVALRPKLVMTDLRLIDDSDSHRSFSKLSGALLIKELRKQAPAIPILLVTASNRADGAQLAKRAGADAYWSKEGIGDRSSPDGAVRHAADLVLLVERLLGDDYDLLRVMDRRLKRYREVWGRDKPRLCNQLVLYSDDPYRPWWKEHEWAGGRTPSGTLRVTSVSLNQVLVPLQNLMTMYREYLRTFTMFESAPKSTEDFWVRSMAVQIGRIVEIVHRFDQLDVSDRKSSTIANRQDWLGAAIYLVRNEAAHFSAGTKFERSHIRLLLRALLYWLSTCAPRWNGAPLNTLVTKLLEPNEEDFFLAGLGFHNCISGKSKNFLDE
jgi:CheY-like chemotaxis protein